MHTVCTNMHFGWCALKNITALNILQERAWPPIVSWISSAKIKCQNPNMIICCIIIAYLQAQTRCSLNGLTSLSLPEKCVVVEEFWRVCAWGSEEVRTSLIRLCSCCSHRPAHTSRVSFVFRIASILANAIPGESNWRQRIRCFVISLGNKDSPCSLKHGAKLINRKHPASYSLL